MYFQRHLSPFLKKISTQSKAIALLGPRQVGKSSLLKHDFPNLESFVFDDAMDLFGAREDPDLFLKSFKPPLILDEVQYVPELLSALKRFMDQKDDQGQYFLTGSQNFSVMKNIVESMAGRVSIMRLYPMTYLERYNIKGRFWLDAYLKREEDWYQNSHPHELPFDLFTIIWLGGMPGLIDKEMDFVETFFSSYFETYIQKDVRVLAEIKNLNDFAKFTRLLSMNASQEINFSELGREIGIANSTALEWKNHLLNSFIWQEAMPYSGNTIKRLSQKPKGYIMDTGLLCYLQMIQSPKSLAQHPHVGSIFENYFFNQIMGYINSLPNKPVVYHWRTSNQQEVDFVLQFDGWLYPIEIKLKSNVSSKDAQGIENFRKTYSKDNIHTGIVVYTGEKIRYLSDNILAVPWNIIL